MEDFTLTQEKSDQEVLMENCTLWALNTSGWAGTDKLSAQDLGKDESDIPDIFTLGNKKLLPYGERIALNRPRTKLVNGFRKLGMPFPIRAIHVIPNDRVMLAKACLEERIAENKANLESFLGRYDEIREAQIKRYPILENAEWPDPDTIRKAFKIKYMVFEIANTKVRITDPEELAQLKTEYADELKKSLSELKQIYIEQGRKVIIDNCKLIHDRIMNSTGKITIATLKKPQKLIEDYEAIAGLFDLDEVKEKINQLKAVLGNVTSKDIKASASIAENFARAIKKLGDDIESMPSDVDETGRVRRVVELKKAA